jgi:hypothetical protein
VNNYIMTVNNYLLKRKTKEKAYHLVDKKILDTSIHNDCVTFIKINEIEKQENMHFRCAKKTTEEITCPE